MVGGCVVDHLISILKDINADEFFCFIAPDEDQGLVINFLGPFYVTPKLYVRAPADCCVKAAVAPGNGAKISAY